MRAVCGLLTLSLAGCLASEMPADQYVARRHACPSLEGRSFTSPAAGKITVTAEDAAYSGYEWTHADGEVSLGLVQCENTAATTLLYIDAGIAVGGRLERVPSATSMIWFGEPFASTNLAN